MKTNVIVSIDSQAMTDIVVMHTVENIDLKLRTDMSRTEEKKNLPYLRVATLIDIPQTFLCVMLIKMTCFIWPRVFIHL